MNPKSGRLEEFHSIDEAPSEIRKQIEQFTTTPSTSDPQLAEGLTVQIARHLGGQSLDDLKPETQKMVKDMLQAVATGGPMAGVKMAFKINGVRVGVVLLLFMLGVFTAILVYFLIRINAVL
jgi:hypothetical protein